MEKTDIERMLRSLEKEIKATKIDVDQGQALLRLEAIAKNYEGDDRVISSEELWELVKNQPVKEKFYTGFRKLDETMEGFVTGESIFLTGITKHGKTSVCMEFSVRFKDQNPLWLSFEERAIDLLRKFNEKTGDLPLLYTPKQNERPTLDWVEKKIVEAKAKFNSKVVFIDHMGFVSDAEKGKDDSEASRLERISRALHGFAVKWDVLIFLMGHLHQVKIDQNPNIENIKGSTGMAQESDLTMLVWRKTERINGKIEISDETNLSLQANRRGKTGNIEFLYKNGRFLEHAWELNGHVLETWQ